MKKFMIAGAIIIIVVVMVLMNMSKSREGNDSIASFGSKKAQEVEAEVIKKGEISASVLITGNVEEVNKKELMATTPIDIIEVLVQEGDDVLVGEALFTADLSTFEDELAQLRISYEIQSLQLERLQVLSTLSDTTSLEIAVELARLSLNSSERFQTEQAENLEKNQRLYEEGIISNSDYKVFEEAAVEAVTQFESSSLSLERSEAELSNGRKTNSSTKESTEIDVKVQLKNLESLDMNIAKLEKQIAEIKALMQAPMSGVVTISNIMNGETSSTMVPLLTIVDIAKLKVTSSIREYDISDMALGQKVFITGDAIESETKVIGEVTFIAPVAVKAVISGRETTAVKIEIGITEGVKYLKPGYTTDCEIMTEIKKDVVIASYNMFREDEDGNRIVLLVNDQNLIEERAVELGTISDFDAEIISGIEEGDMIVMNPSLALKEGSKVRVTNDLEEEGH